MILDANEKYVASIQIWQTPRHMGSYDEERRRAGANFLLMSANGAELVRSIWEDQRTRLNIRKDWPELAEAIDKLVGHE